ncbi:MAG: cytochrome P450 [Deltaproteobacteria bacterium]|nr:cytochrome P450 [Deltaproteobacteria bacterium]
MDLYDPDVFQDGGVPHEDLTWLRRNAPVYFHPEPGGPGYYAVTKYDDICAISKDPGTFSSARGGTNIQDYAPGDLSLIRLMMLNMDPPQHAKFRRLVQRGFTPRMVSLLEPKIRDSARMLVDRIAHKGECEFVTEIAAELPLLVIADLIGVPHEDRHKIFDWSNQLIGFDDPEFQNSMEDARMAAAQMWGYANTLAQERKGHEGDDLVSVLMKAEVDGGELSIMEFDAFFLLLSVAGNETTRNLISGGMWALIENPAERQRLLDDPSLIPSAVEEMLRWVTPVLYFRRTATRDTEIRGVPIRENDKVCMYYASANRDEDVFENPQRFDVGRTPNEHIAFGVGEHFCMGASLARLEIRLMFEELLRRLPDMELVAPPRRLRSNFINGVKEMRLRYTPER